MANNGHLTVHVLDTATGRPAEGLSLSLLRIEPSGSRLLGTWKTNADGRCHNPLLSSDALTTGTFEIVFDIGAWRVGDPGFYDLIPIRFKIVDPEAHTHIPLLLSPYGYTTYRGS